MVVHLFLEPVPSEVQLEHQGRAILGGADAAVLAGQLVLVHLAPGTRESGHNAARPPRERAAPRVAPHAAAEARPPTNAFGVRGEGTTAAAAAKAAGPSRVADPCARHP